MIGALLRMPVDAVWARILARLHDAGFDDLVPAHMSVMRWPGPQGRRPSEIAKQTGMTKQAVNYLLRQLEQLGYLERVDDPDDQRSKRIELTSRGRAAVLNIRATVRQIEREWERELGIKEVAQLRALLVDLNATSLVAAHNAPGT
jgi:DNA-binding MarR family transcriptional regulator